VVSSIHIILIYILLSIVSIGFVLDAAKIDLLKNRRVTFAQLLGMNYAFMAMGSYVLYAPFAFILPSSATDEGSNTS
jgi:hypothetical protein